MSATVSKVFGIFIPQANKENMSENQGNSLSFEDFGNGDEVAYWWASDFMDMLGYPNMASFTKVLLRAMQSCISANIEPSEDFKRESRVINGTPTVDYKLTRFGCYMVAMNGDIKKPQVAAAQVYFANTAEKVNLVLEGAVDVDRLTLRGEIKEGNKSLFAVAKSVGVKDFAIFNDNGYKGMYNMSMPKLLKHKGVASDLFDYMGKEELSANQFRITMTEAKLKARNVTNAMVANSIHKDVGAGVRKMVYESTGKLPENLPLERKLNVVSKELKKANKQLNKSKGN